MIVEKTAIIEEVNNENLSVSIDNIMIAKIDLI